jgi:hypothetical protein
MNTPPEVAHQSSKILLLRNDVDENICYYINETLQLLLSIPSFTVDVQKLYNKYGKDNNMLVTKSFLDIMCGLF